MYRKSVPFISARLLVPVSLSTSKVRLLTLYIFYTFLTYPISTFAQGAGDGTDIGGGGGDGSSGTRVEPSETIAFENPLGNTTLLGLFNSILDVLLIFAVPIIVFFIIYAGFQYVFARGDTNAIQNANRALLYSVIGGVLILGAKVLLAVISNTIAAIGG